MERWEGKEQILSHLYSTLIQSVIRFVKIDELVHPHILLILLNDRHQCRTHFVHYITELAQFLFFLFFMSIRRHQLIFFSPERKKKK